MSPARIRTRDPSNQAAADLSHRRHGHRDRRICSLLTLQKMCESTFLCNAPHFFKSIAFWKVPRLRAFVPPLRAKSREDEYTALVERYEQGTTDVFRDERVPLWLCPPQISHELTWDWNRATAVTGRRPTAWTTTRPLLTKINLNCI